MKTPTQRTFAALIALSLFAQAAAQSASYASVAGSANEAKFNFRVTLIPVPGTVSEVKAKLEV